MFAATYPTRHLGFLSPLDLMDTQIYELYRIAPAHVIASFISAGLRAFSADAVEDCLSARLETGVSELVKRGAELVVLGATPMELLASPQRWEQFLELASEAPLGGTGGLDAVAAAFRAVGASRIAVVNKWDAHVNALLDVQLRQRGIDVVATITSVRTVDEIKGSFASGTSMAIDLVREAARTRCDGIWIAGGAWLTLDVCEQLEAEVERPVIGLLPALNWYCLQLLGEFVPIEGLGSLMRVRAPELARRAST